VRVKERRAPCEHARHGAGSLRPIVEERRGPAEPAHPRARAACGRCPFRLRGRARPPDQGNARTPGSPCSSRRSGSRWMRRRRLRRRACGCTGAEAGGSRACAPPNGTVARAGVGYRFHEHVQTIERLSDKNGCIGAPSPAATHHCERPVYLRKRKDLARLKFRRSTLSCLGRCATQNHRSGPPTIHVPSQSIGLSVLRYAFDFREVAGIDVALS
jgi:hypothetical protein